LRAHKDVKVDRPVKYIKRLDPFRHLSLGARRTRHRSYVGLLLGFQRAEPHFGRGYLTRIIADWRPTFTNSHNVREDGELKEETEFASETVRPVVAQN
jgi:hypothetical protein